MAWDIGADQYVAEITDTELVIQDVIHAHVIDNVVLQTWQTDEANFGYEEAGDYYNQYDGSVVGSLFALPVAGQITSITAYVGRSAGWDIGADQRAAGSVGSVQFAIYDSAGNHLGHTASGTLGAYGWMTLDLTASVELEAGDYILCSNSDDALGYAAYAATGGTGETVVQAFGTWPATLVFVEDGTKKYSIYATYNPVSADTLLVIQDVTHAHTVDSPILTPLLFSGVNYLRDGSLSVSLGGAGMSPNPIAGSWGAEIHSPDGMFHPLHPTSEFKDYFRVGRPVRISLGASYDGVDYWWTRLTGFIDAPPPRYNHGSQMITIGGGDYMARLTNTKLSSPNNYWGELETFDSIATAQVLGVEIYTEADALDTLAEANNLASWTPTNANFAPQLDDGGGSTYVGLMDAINLNAAASALDENVGSFTVGKQYVVSFKYKRTSTNPVTCKVSCHIYKTGTTTVWGGVAGLLSTSWATASFQFTCPETAAGRMKLAMTAPVLAGRYIQVDQVSIKEVTGQINTRYELPEGCNGPYYAVLDGIPYWLGDDEKGWHYDEAGRLFYFDDALTIAAGENKLLVYYYTTQMVEIIVAHLLATAGLYSTWSAALAAMDYTATGVTIPRAWFEAGTSVLEAITMLCERVNYRFWFDEDGTPVFKPAPVAAASVFDFTATGHVQSPEDYQSDEEIKNRIVIEGIEQGMYSMREDKLTSRLTGEASDATSIAAYLERTLSIQNHLFQTQASIDAMCATLLAAYKDPKWYSDVVVPYNPVPLQLGDTITWKVPLTPASGATAETALTMTGIIRDVKINSNTVTYKCQLVVP